MIKAVVQREKSWTLQLVQERYYPVSILQPQATNSDANFLAVNLPSGQMLTLTRTNVLVDNIHAACRRVLIFVNNAALAKFTASAIASQLTLPSYS